MGYDKMQSIDMGVKHHDDHEGNMAKRQMFKTAQYAAEIFDNIQDGDEFPAWIQSKMTKVADYIGAVKHYLEYDHVMGRNLTRTPPLVIMLRTSEILTPHNLRASQKRKSNRWQ